MLFIYGSPDVEAVFPADLLHRGGELDDVAQVIAHFVVLFTGAHVLRRHGAALEMRPLPTQTILPRGIPLGDEAGEGCLVLGGALLVLQLRQEELRDAAL